MGRLRIESNDDGDTHVIGLAGELDTVGCPALETELERAEDAGGPIVIDMTLLSFVDSTGIGLLVAALRRSKQVSSRLLFIPSRSEDVQKLLEICGLDSRLPYVD